MAVTVSIIAERVLRRLGVNLIPMDDAPTYTELVPVATIATMALQELGVIAADETPSASDQALMLDKVNSVQAAFDAQGVVYWATNSVPRAFVEEYTKIAGAQAASSFGKAMDAQMLLLMEQRVRRGVMRFSGHDVAVEAVMATHNNLTARGLARWTVFDIPVAAEMPYEQLAAALCAGKFDKQLDPNDVMMATRALVQIIAMPTSGERVVAQYF